MLWKSAVWVIRDSRWRFPHNGLETWANALMNGSLHEEVEKVGFPACCQADCVVAKGRGFGRAPDFQIPENLSRLRFNRSRLGNIANRDLAGLQGFRHFAQQGNVQQAVVKVGTFHFDVVGEMETTFE